MAQDYLGGTRRIDREADNDPTRKTYPNSNTSTESLTTARVASWQNYIATNGLTGELNNLPTWLKTEVEGGYFDIRRGMLVEKGQPEDYKTLYSAWIVWQATL